MENWLLEERNQRTEKSSTQGLFQRAWGVPMALSEFFPEHWDVSPIRGSARCWEEPVTEPEKLSVASYGAVSFLSGGAEHWPVCGGRWGPGSERRCLFSSWLVELWESGGTWQGFLSWEGDGGEVEVVCMLKITRRLKKRQSVPGFGDRVPSFSVSLGLFLLLGGAA